MGGSKWWCVLLVAAMACSESEGQGEVGDLGDLDAPQSDALPATDVAEPDIGPILDAIDDEWSPDLGSSEEGPEEDGDLEDEGDTGEQEFDAEEGGPISDAVGDVGEGEGDAEQGGEGEGGVPEPTVKPDFSKCSPPGGTRNIYDLQNPACPDHITPAPVSPASVEVSLTGVVVSGVFSDTFFVQELDGGPYSGIAVFANKVNFKAMQPGDIVTVVGNYSEFYGLSQIYLNTWSKTGSAAPPEPFLAEHPAHLATDGALSQMFEGVLVRVENVKTIHTKPDCPDDWNEFMVTGDLRIDDMGYRWDARLGDHFATITGPLHYTFGNFKIEPRNAFDFDVVGVGAGTALSKCVADSCEVSESMMGTQQVVINEIMVDAAGNDTGQEWFELFNPGDQPVDVSGWQVRDCGSQKFTLVGSKLTIPAKGYLVFGANGDPNTNGGALVNLAYGSALYFPNTVGSLLLFDGSSFTGKLVDQVRYSKFSPWTALVPGRSIERINATASGVSHENWKAGSTPYGPVGINQGTPGAPNAAALASQ